MLALAFRIGPRLLGLVLAFGVGVLLSAVAYELVAEAYDMGHGSGALALGLPAGALTFYVGDRIIDHLGGEGRKRSDREDTGPALPITLGIVLDGIPESIVLGLTLLTGSGVSVAVLAAVFLSNLPESLAATTGLRLAAGAPRGSWGCGSASHSYAVSRLSPATPSSKARRRARSDSSTHLPPVRS